MPSTTIHNLVALSITGSIYAYFLIFIAMVLEGPLVTAGASFAAALGYLDIRIILLLAIAGDLVVDIGAYAVGRAARKPFAEKLLRRAASPTSFIKKIERLLHSHTAKAILLIKMTPLVPTIGLTLVGAARVPFLYFLIATAGIVAARAAVFAAVGYYFGFAYGTLVRVVRNVQIAVAIIALGAAIVYYLYRKIIARFSPRNDITSRR
ncbi:hypothetical protein D6833_10180 [Candidatus Parcubacteria bacterium]|nr:MAG: hypothetical protein D6833_10180 [Candidatus Parcubacteria bacterium]